MQRVVGYIEAKTPEHDLNLVERTEQIERYKNTFPNFILTNFLEFRFFRNGVRVDIANICEYEQISIYNVTNGQRFTTYAIRAERHSGIISVNGAAAHKAHPQDIIIIASFANYDEAELKTYSPQLVYVDNHNHIQSQRNAIPAQAA